MAGTRSSARLNNSSPSSAKSTSGNKRKADDSSPSSKAKRGRATAEQKTLEETMPADDKHTEVEDAQSNGAQTVEGAEADKANPKAEDEDTAMETNGTGKDSEQSVANGSKDEATQNDDEIEDNATNGEKKDDDKDDDKSALDHVKADADQSGTTTKEGNAKDAADTTEATASAEAVKEDESREKAMPSNILEKGIIYFFTRGRVGVEDPDSVQDLARSYFVLRPLPHGAKLADGAVQDVGNNRLLALPKKVWPKSGKDRFMVFVDKAKVSMETLKEEFFGGSEYSTQTVGTRHTPEVTPLGEGVYAMTSTGGGQGTTHLAYMLTIPSDIGDVQKDVGLAEKGSFVLSVKNPEASAPANAQLPQGAEYPKEIIEEFRGRGWMPAQPKHIDYDNASILLIGENFDSSSNLDPAPKDEKDGSKETPQEELEKLEHEDELRIEHLKGDDTIFADLGISKAEYPSVLTTW